MKKILSIQSSVTAGFVGNAVAGPVLLALGHHPMLVDTISLAAHPGYGARAGGPLADDRFADQMRGVMHLHGLDDIAMVVSGYLGSAGQIAPLSELVTAWRGSAGAQGDYILDPVMGDAGRLYVAPALADGIRDKLLPLADIITPNQFELGYLSGIEITSRQSAGAAARILLAESRLKAVLATGISAGPHAGFGDLMITRDAAEIWQPASDTTHNVAGGGDLLTALFSGALATGLPLQDAFLHASKTAQAVIAASPTTRDLALLENIEKLRPA